MFLLLFLSYQILNLPTLMIIIIITKAITSWFQETYILPRVIVCELFDRNH
jgi:hypothetical protein